MPIPVVAIIGRPNVGKSTLFNRLLGKRKAIVEDLPGTTVDRIHSDISWEGHDLTLVDCGGLEARPGASIRRKVRDQVDKAVAEADLVLFMVDARDGVLPADQETADIIRRARKTTMLVVNKVDTPKQETEVLQFYELAMGDPIPVSAYHHRGIEELMQKVIGKLPAPTASVAEPDSMKIAIVGRPNVEKSLLLNTLLGEERVVVDEVAGTTRDTIDTVMQYKGERVTLIDTAGIRRQGRIDQGIERYSSQRTDDFRLQDKRLPASFFTKTRELVAAVETVLGTKNQSLYMLLRVGHPTKAPTRAKRLPLEKLLDKEKLTRGETG